MKRRISLLLAVVMILGSFSMVFAAEETAEEKAGAFLMKVGVLEGINGDLKLEDNLRRQDMVVLVARLHGAEEEAEKFPTEDLTFTDFKDPYYRPIIAWAVANNLIEGHTAERFGFNEDVTAQQYATVLLRALGYNDKVATVEGYAKAIEEAKKLGILENVEVENDTVVTRGQMAVMTFNALGVKVKDSEETLAEKLGIEMPAPDKPQELKVEKVYTENLKEVVVELSNAELVKEENLKDIKNYRLANNQVIDVTVEEDTVIVLLDEALTKGKSYSLVLRNLGKEIDGKHGFKAEDNAIPEVVDVKALGEYGILVTTSEPVQMPRGRDFKVDGRNIAMNIEQYGRDIVLTPYYDKEFPEDAKELTVEGLIDFAGFKSAKESFSIEIEKDEVAPEVKEVILKDTNTIEVVFDKDVYKASVGHYVSRRNTGNVSYYLGRHPVYAKDSDKIARNKVRYTFDEELSRRTDITVEGITNHSKVEMEKVEERVIEKVDYTEPEIISGFLWYHEASEKDSDKRLAHLILEFDKDIVGDFDKVEDHFTLYKREVVKRAEVEEAEISVDYLGRKDRLLVSIDNLDLNNKDKDNDYILEVRDFVDTTTAKNRMYRDYVEFELLKGTAFEVNQEVPVKIRPLYTDGTGREIELTFTKPVDRNLAENGINYIFRDGSAVEDLNDLGGDAIVERDGKTVTLTIPNFNEKNYDTLELSIALKDKDGVRLSGSRVYTFATGKWNVVDVKPIEKESAITYINKGKPVATNDLTLVSGVAVNPEVFAINLVGYKGKTAEIRVYKDDALVNTKVVSPIADNDANISDAILSLATDKGAEYEVVTKVLDGKEELDTLTLKVKVVDPATTIKTITYKTADISGATTEATAHKLAYGTDMSKITFPTNKKDTTPAKDIVIELDGAKADFVAEMNDNVLVVKVTAENGDVATHRFYFEAKVDETSTVTPAGNTGVDAADKEIKATIVLKDTAGNAIAGLKADKFSVVGDTTPSNLNLSNIKVTETTAGTYELVITSKGSLDTTTETITIIVDGVELTTTVSVSN